MTWLVTGGAGYIGAHVVRGLTRAGVPVVALDDLSTGSHQRLPDNLVLVTGSTLDEALVECTLRKHQITGVVHLAAKKAVDKSLWIPLQYYEENVRGLLGVLKAMQVVGCRHLVYSSSAAVYGNSVLSPINEEAETKPINPYGRSKLIGEWMVSDAAAANLLTAVSLRYFNVVGCADPTLADTGTDNLFPRVAHCLLEGQRPAVYGRDYPTPDGTCIRDYVHVSDLAEAHVAAARYVEAQRGSPRHTIFNLGSGRGYSVLEVLECFSSVSGQTITPIFTSPRRGGEASSVIADPTRAASELSWHTQCELKDMVKSTWSAAASSETRAGKSRRLS